MLYRDINYLEIAKYLPLKEDDVLLITGNITKSAFYETHKNQHFDIQAFIDSFKQQLPHGTLLFHAFTDNLVSGDTFDYKKSKPVTGSLSAAAWKDPGFIRTKDPFHSFSVWGKHKDDLQKINNQSTFGHDSVFAWLHQNKAKILLIDVSLEEGFTFAHYCEESIGVPYRKHIKHKIIYIDENGNKTIEEQLFYTRKSGYYNSFGKLEKTLEEKNIMQIFPLNESEFKLIDSNAAYDLIKENILKNKASFLSGFSYKKWMYDAAKNYYENFCTIKTKPKKGFFGKKSNQNGCIG